MLQGKTLIIIALLMILVVCTIAFENGQYNTGSRFLHKREAYLRRMAELQNNMDKARNIRI